MSDKCEVCGGYVKAYGASVRFRDPGYTLIHHWCLECFCVTMLQRMVDHVELPKVVVWL